MKAKIVTVAKMTLICSSLLVSLTACTDLKQKLGLEKDKEIQKVSVTVSDQMSAEQLAQAAEQLVGPYTFMLASKAADMALEKDPENLRAQFYKHFLGRMMVYQGILTRIKPYYRAHENLANLEEAISGFPNTPLKDFLIDGKEDIASIEQIQDVVVSYRESLNSFRKFLRTHPDLSLTVNLNPSIWSSAVANSNQTSYEENCVIKVEQKGEGNRSYKAACDFSGLFQKKLNSADVLALSQITAGELLYLNLYSSYGWNGLDTLSKAQEGEQKMTPAEAQMALEKIPGLGVLRADQAMSEIVNLGSDFASAYKWAISKKNEICPAGRESAKSRKGYLFSKGICAYSDSSTDRALALFDQALQGAVTMNLWNNQTQSSVITQLDYFSLSRNPVKDLRSIAPSSYDACGNVRTWRDRTLGGVYPLADAETFLEKSCGQ